ncbi:threonine--tRNA ligase 2, cytoplasmic-like [Cyprinus carpio]|uniref:Threonine--tRNA ligase 2, cytoplasmic-like n=1 Tax=Cyprinus carpio TaxID=7962 RepID=A0A9Q9XED3_CYPCA|nr:threonine--tRNA ligase 2, cytoplasmic-like [Cyprinus carpio]
MSERMAARLSAQEEQIEALSREILRLQDGLTGGFLSCDPSLDALRAENEKLRYRALHLRRSLREEQQLQERDQSQRTSSQKSQNKPEELKEKIKPNNQKHVGK